ncbi:MAG: myo-inositol 2-dehydrogenase / D-chiro-inositol 1-dehydrogenase [Chloroflexota bacterium]|nr:myo-inositol 2-dehydrogenase / D-chiro-inositol 1-dehydrogenase [Chloroflexota bacterium]
MAQETRKSIAVGIIGTGGMGTRHAGNIHRLVDGARVSAVYDTDAHNAANAAAVCDGAQIFDDPQQLIDSPAVDAVLVASPDETHSAMTLACLKAGKPVLCEKPLATNVADAEAVVQAEMKLGKRLVSVGFMRRFDPQHAAVKEAVMSGDLGLPLLWKGVHRNASSAYGTSGATVLTNSAGHDMDSARFLLGEEVLEVYVRGVKTRPELHPDTRDLLVLNMHMTHDKMAVGEVFVNADYGYEVSAEVVCQFGTALTQQPDKVMLRSKAHRGYFVSADWLSPFTEAYIAEDRAWIESLQNGTVFTGASAWDGYMAMAVTTACIESLHSGKIVPVETIEKAEMYK